MSKQQEVGKPSYIQEIVIFGFAAVALILAVLKYPNTNLLAWFIPAGVIAVYLVHRFLTGELDKKHRKSVSSSENSVSWKQLSIQIATYVSLYLITTGLLRGSVQGYNELFSVCIAVGYFFLVPLALKKFVWPKFFADKKGV